MKAKISNHSRSIYLAKLPRLARKLRVMMDWTLNLLFGREIRTDDHFARCPSAKRSRRPDFARVGHNHLDSRAIMKEDELIFVRTVRSVLLWTGHHDALN
jgi:hypothetical protein